MFDTQDDMIPSNDIISISDMSMSKIGTIVSVTWFSSICVFFSQCKHAYVETFYSTQDIKTYIQEWWENMIYTGQPDQEIIKIFTKHRDFYKHFEEQIKQWVDINWIKWKREKPFWFTEKLIHTIPDSIVSKHIKDNLFFDNQNLEKSI